MAIWSESSNLQTTITSTSRVLTGMTRWLAPSLACEKAWSGPKNGFPFHWRRALVCSHSISKAAENHYSDSSLIVLMFYLLQLLLSPLPLHLLIISLVANFQSSSPNTEQVASTEEMCCVHQNKKRKQIPLWGLCTQTRTLSSTLLQNLPYWVRLNIENELYSFHVPYHMQLISANAILPRLEVLLWEKQFC